jgi:hypothetical protein
MQFLSRDLTSQYISNSYQDVVQRYQDGSTDWLLDGLGYTILGILSSSVGGIILTQDQTSSLIVTSSYIEGYNVDGFVLESVSASYIEGYNVDGAVLESLSSLFSSQSISSSFSSTASYVITANTSSYPWIKTGNDISYVGGKVGIGTATPKYLLHVYSASVVPSSSLVDVLAVEVSAGGGLISGFGPSIVFKDAGSSAKFLARIGGVYEPGAPGSFLGGLSFYTNPSTSPADSTVERMRITNTGKVGIGLTNPTNSLDVSGNISCSVITASIFNGTSSWATNVVNTGSGGTTLTTGSIYQITASWANNVISASFLNNISQDLIPLTNNTYDLGASDRQWKDLFVSSGSIYLNNIPLSMIDGTISIDGKSIMTSDTVIPSSSYSMTSNTVGNLSFSDNSILINSNTTDSIAPEALKIVSISSGSYNLLSGYGTVNKYFQINIKNSSNSVSASSDFVATSDNGTESSSYINMGINSSTYKISDYDIESFNGGYLFTAGGDLSIGTKTPGKKLIFHTGGTKIINKIIEISDGLISITGSIGINSGSLIGTASWANQSDTSSVSLYANTASYSFTSSYELGYEISSSYASSSTWAISASWSPSVDLPHVEKGIVSGSDFSGSPKYINVNYSKTFLNNIYIISIIGDDARLWTANNRTTSSFTINSNSNQPIIGMVMWRIEEI